MLFFVVNWFMYHSTLLNSCQIAIQKLNLLVSIYQFQKSLFSVSLTSPGSIVFLQKMKKAIQFWKRPVHRKLNGQVMWKKCHPPHKSATFKLFPHRRRAPQYNHGSEQQRTSSMSCNFTLPKGWSMKYGLCQKMNRFR